MIQFPPRSILVPYDFSRLSTEAWRRADRLARRFGASLEIVHVEPWQPVAELAALPAPSPSEFRPIRARIRAAIGASPRITVTFGDPAERVLDLVRQRRPDLVVMGTHGRQGLERFVLGSVAESVVRRSTAPVLVLRGPAKPIRAVLAPVNFTDYSDYGFAYAAGVAAALGARLTAFNVNDDPVWNGEPRARLAGLIARLPAPLREACRPRPVSAAGGAAPEGIIKSLRGHQLVVLVARKKSAVEDALLGTTAERILRRSPVPVLAVPAPRSPFAFAGAGVHSGRAIQLLPPRSS